MGLILSFLFALSVWIWIFFFLGWWPGPVLVAVVFPIATRFFMSPMRRTGRLNVWSVLPAVLALLVCVSVFYGWASLSIPASEFSFSSDPEMADGWYLRMGETNHEVILRSCDDGDVFFVKREDVMVEKLANLPDSEIKLASLLNILFYDEDAPAGATYLCPSQDLSKLVPRTWADL